MAIDERTARQEAIGLRRTESLDGTLFTLYYNVRRCHTQDVSEQLLWDDDSAAYIGSRSSRYPDAMDIHITWTQEVMTDPEMVALKPDPKSRIGVSRFIGRSSTAGRVLVVIAYRDLDNDLLGVNAWPATGLDILIYEEGTDDGKDI